MGSAVRFVRVVVRAARHGETKPLGHRAITRRRGRIVVAVIRLDRVEARRDEPGDPFIASDQPGMRHRCEAARVVDPRDDLVWRSGLARHERRPAPSRVER